MAQVELVSGHDTWKPHVTITLSEYEARCLVAILGGIGGGSDVGDLYDELACLVPNECDSSLVNENGDKVVPLLSNNSQKILARYR